MTSVLIVYLRMMRRLGDILHTRMHMYCWYTVYSKGGHCKFNHHCQVGCEIDSLESCLLLFIIVAVFYGERWLSSTRIITDRMIRVC